MAFGERSSGLSGMFWGRGILVSMIHCGGQRQLTGSQEKVRESLHLRLHLRLLVSYDSKYSADPNSMLRDVLLVLFFFSFVP